MALSHIGEGIVASNVDTDGTPEAKVCRRFLDVAIEAVLRDFDWSFARKYANFNLVATAPTLEWGFSYRYPPDCLNLKYIVTGVRRPGAISQVPFKLGSDGAGLLVYTDMPDMQGAYTVKVENPALFPPDFVLALSFYLSVLILPRLSAGDPYKQLPGLQQQYLFSMAKARQNAANEEVMDREPESEFITVRGGDHGHRGPRRDH